MTMIPAKTAEPIEMPFGMWTQMDARNYVLDGDPHPQAGMGTFEGDDVGIFPPAAEHRFQWH